MKIKQGLVAGLVMALAVPLPLAQAAPLASAPADPGVLATAAADQAAATGVDALAKGADESFSRLSTTQGGAGLYFSSYERRYRGIPVVGGDAVVVTDGQGRVHSTTAAHTAQISVGTTAKVPSAQAANTARTKVSTVDSVSSPKLVVLAGAVPQLAYEVVVTGYNGRRPANLHVFVNASTGAVVDAKDDVKGGNGDSHYAGGVTIDTQSSGGQFSTTDPTRSGIKCGRNSNQAVFTGPDDNWGNGTGTDLETACVDALYSVQKEWDMLRDWLGRNGINGSGGGFPAYVGLADVNAYWNGSYTAFGHSQDNQRQATPMDVVGHEFGHAIFQTTPGGTGSGNENGGLNESTGDIFGALTEAYADNAQDPADYEVGEGANLVGSGPIRYMYQPNKVSGHPNCYSSSISNTEVHAGAGPQNHWFYLVAEGSNPSGKPASPTCDNSTVTGLGIQKAGKIFYNGLLRKTSAWNHAAARKATLEASIALFPGSCAEFDTVKAAWTAVSVPAVSGEPTCTPQGAPSNGGTR